MDELLKVKICLISNLYNPYILGGAEIYVEQIAKYLANDNEVVIITTKPYNSLNSLKPSVELHNNIKIYRYYPLNIYYTYNAKQTTYLIKPIWHAIDLWNPHSYFIIKKILKKEKPDIVHTHNLGGLSLSTFSAIKLLRIPHVHTLHDYAFLCPRATLLKNNGDICKYPNILCKKYRYLKKVLSYSPNIVTAPSQFVLNMHTKNAYLSNSKCIKLPLGIEINQNQKLEKDYNTIDILFVGQIVKHKGVQILIEAFNKLDYNNIKLHIVGKGPDLEEFKKLAGNNKRIEFCGFVPNENLKELYEQANVVVLPSLWYDNSPVVIYESFKYGTPVIGSNIGGIPELVEEGYNGFLFEVGKVDELKNLIELLIQNSRKLKELSKNALKYIKNFDIKKHIIKLEKIYSDIGCM